MFSVEISLDGNNWFECGMYFFLKNAISHKNEIETQISSFEIYVRVV